MLVVSPHFDDAVLSCWHLLDGEDDVRVVNVFTGSPPAGSPPGYWDDQTGAADPARRVAERKAEDEAALAMAGRASLDLGFLDGQHRRDPLEPQVVEEMLRELVFGNGPIAAPMGLDGHDDHCVARDAAVALRADGVDVLLYADLPHASIYGWPDLVANGETGWREPLEAVGVDPAGLTVDIHRLSPDALRRKLVALGRYRTQIEALEETFGLFLGSDLLACEAVWRYGRTS